jgi:hypothetical protein
MAQGKEQHETKNDVRRKTNAKQKNKKQNTIKNTKIHKLTKSKTFLNFISLSFHVSLGVGAVPP